MEQRRTVEIGLFGALTSFQIALAALALGQAGKATQGRAAWFAAASPVMLWLLYAAMTVTIEILNRNNRHGYLSYEAPSAPPPNVWDDVKRSWAAWPIVAAFVDEIFLLVLVLTLP